MLNTYISPQAIPTAILFHQLPIHPISYEMKKKCCKKYKKAGKKRCKNCPNR